MGWRSARFSAGSFASCGATSSPVRMLRPSKSTMFSGSKASEVDPDAAPRSSLVEASWAQQCGAPAAPWTANPLWTVAALTLAPFTTDKPEVGTSELDAGLTAPDVGLLDELKISWNVGT